MQKTTPLIALIGLPNAGKSTLLNKLTGTRAITALEAHTTRDLNYAEDFWEGIFMQFVDTGGLVPDPTDKVLKEVQIKSWSAISRADLLIWVMDRKKDPESIPQKTLQQIWKSGKPFIIAVNKVDNPNKAVDIADYAFLGMNGFVNMSCNTGFGMDELMDSVMENLIKLGFEQDFDKAIFKSTAKTRRSKDRTHKLVKKGKDGKFFVVRNDAGMFESLNSEELEKEIAGQREIDEENVIDPEIEEIKQIKYKNLIFDLGGVVLDLRYHKMDEYLQDRFRLKPRKDYSPDYFWKGADKNGDKFEKIEFWIDMVKKLDLVNRDSKKKA